MLTISLSGCFSNSKKTMVDLKDSQRQSAWLQQIPEHLQSHPAFDYVRDNLDLPRVLLIGDSISIGYTPKVRELLKAKANVHRAPTNCGPTGSGLVNMPQWLGDGKWNVIHFNFGLHDIMYINEKGELSKEGQQVNSVKQYKQNIEQIAIQLKTAAPKVIFAATTPVTEGTAGFVVGDPAKYNTTAIEVMNKHAIAVNNLHDFKPGSLEEYQLPTNVHFNEKGYDFLAQKVVLAITNALE